MIDSKGKGAAASLRARRLGIDTYQEAVIYLRRDSSICRSEGFEALSRVQVEFSNAARPTERIRTLHLPTSDHPGIHSPSRLEA